MPTGLVSIPLRYMHTSVETANMKDVISSGKLLAYYIANLPEELRDTYVIKGIDRNNGGFRR